MVNSGWEIDKAFIEETRIQKNEEKLRKLLMGKTMRDDAIDAFIYGMGVMRVESTGRVTSVPAGEMFSTEESGA